MSGRAIMSKKEGVLSGSFLYYCPSSVFDRISDFMCVFRMVFNLEILVFFRGDTLAVYPEGVIRISVDSDKPEISRFGFVIHVERRVVFILSEHQIARFSMVNSFWAQDTG